VDCRLKYRCCNRHERCDIHAYERCDKHADERCNTHADERCDTRADERCDTRADERCDTHADECCDTHADERCDTRADERCNTRADERCDTHADERCVDVRADVSAEEEEEIDVEGLAAQWLDTTVTAAANVYAKSIAQIPLVTQEVRYRIDKSTWLCFSQLVCVYLCVCICVCACVSVCVRVCVRQTCTPNQLCSNTIGHTPTKANFGKL